MLLCQDSLVILLLCRQEYLFIFTMDNPPLLVRLFSLVMEFFFFFLVCSALVFIRYLFACGIILNFWYLARKTLALIGYLNRVEIQL